MVLVGCVLVGACIALGGGKSRSNSVSACERTQERAPRQTLGDTRKSAWLGCATLANHAHTRGESLPRGGQPKRRFPVDDWIFGYQKEWLRPDLIAGLTTAAVVIPKAMAYATIAGLPVQVGLYTAFLPMVIYAVLGSSRPLSVSTTTTIAILAATQFGEIAPGADAATLLKASAMLTLMVGGILNLAAVLRLGFFA